MGDLTKLLELIGDNGFTTFISLAFIIMAGVIAGVQIWGKFSKIIGRPVKWIKEKDEARKLTLENSKAIQELTKRDKVIREELQILSTTVNEIANRLDIMQNKIDATEMVKLKEKILAYYRKYKDLGEWEKFEADVFWGLYDRYISHGGNSFVAHEIEPIMRELQVK